jgi:hypothetical protein
MSGPDDRLVHIPEPDGSVRIERHLTGGGTVVVGWTFPLSSEPKAAPPVPSGGKPDEK